MSKEMGVRPKDNSVICTPGQRQNNPGAGDVGNVVRWRNRQSWWNSERLEEAGGWRRRGRNSSSSGPTGVAWNWRHEARTEPQFDPTSHAERHLSAEQPHPLARKPWN